MDERDTTNTFSHTLNISEQYKHINAVEKRILPSPHLFIEAGYLPPPAPFRPARFTKSDDNHLGKTSFFTTVGKFYMEIHTLFVDGTPSTLPPRKYHHRKYG